MGRPSDVERERKQRKLSEKQLAYAVWLAQPAGLRQPSTMEDLATVLGTTRQVLWRWGKDPRVLDASRYVVLQNAGDPAKVTQVLDMLFNVAISKCDPKVADIWLKAVGVTGASGRDQALWEEVNEDALDVLSDETLAALKQAKELELAERAQMEKATERLAE